MYRFAAGCREAQELAAQAANKSVRGLLLGAAHLRRTPSDRWLRLPLSRQQQQQLKRRLRLNKFMSMQRCVIADWLDGVLARFEPLSVRRPPAPEQDEFLGLGKTEEEAVAALTSKNNLCTCGQGVPSFLCRVRKC